MLTQQQTQKATQIDTRDEADLMVSALVVVTILRDQPLTDYEKTRIQTILENLANTPNFKVKTLLTELEHLYNQGDKELESLVTTFKSLFD